MPNPSDTTSIEYRALTLTVRTPQCSHTLRGKKLLLEWSLAKILVFGTSLNTLPRFSQTHISLFIDKDFTCEHSQRATFAKSFRNLLANSFPFITCMETR
jgi:hypothetical protein